MGDRARSLTIDGVRLIKDLKVVELKAELERRGLSKSGSKKELVERLRSSVQFENTKSKATAAVNEEDVPNRWLQNEPNLDNNDYIREYFQSQKALYRQQIEVRRQYRETATATVPGTSELVSGSTTDTPQSSTPLPPEPPPPKVIEAKVKKVKAEPPPPPPESPSTSNCSRPSRSSARAARVLSRVSLEDSEDDNSEEEDHHHRPQPPRRSRKRSVRQTHAYQEGSDHQPGYASNEPVSLDLKDRVPSLKIKLPDTVPNIIDELPKRKEDSSSAKRESSYLTDTRVSVTNQTPGRKHLIEPVKEICIPEVSTSLRVPVTSLTCADTSERKLSLKVIPPVSPSHGKTLIKEREKKYPSEDTPVTALSAELQPVVSLKRIQQSGEHTVLKATVKPEISAKSSSINSQSKCIDSDILSIEVHEQPEKVKELKNKGKISSVASQQKHEVAKSTPIVEPPAKVESDKDTLQIVETHSAVHKASDIKKASESVLVKGESDQYSSGTVLQSIKKVEKAKKSDCNAVEVTKQLSNLLPSTVTVSKVDNLTVTEVTGKKADGESRDLLETNEVKDLGEIRKVLSSDSLSVEVVHVLKEEAARKDSPEVEEVPVKSAEPSSQTLVAAAPKVPLTHGPVKAKIWEKLLDTAQKKGDPVKDFSKQGSKDSSPKSDSDQSERPESCKVRREISKEVEKESAQRSDDNLSCVTSENQESILKKLVIAKVSDFEPTSHSITSLLSTSNKDRERERGGIKEIKRLQLGEESGTEDLQKSYTPSLLLSTLCGGKEPDPSVQLKATQQSKDLSGSCNIKTPSVFASETEPRTTQISPHSQTEKTAIHSVERVIQEQSPPVGTSSDAPVQPSAKNALYSVKSLLPKIKSTAEETKLQSSVEEQKNSPKTEGSDTQVLELESKCTEKKILSSKSEVGSNIPESSKQISNLTSPQISQSKEKTQTSSLDTPSLEVVGADKYLDSSDVSKPSGYIPSKEVKAVSSVIQPVHKFKSIESLISDKCEIESKESKKIKQQSIVTQGTALESAQNIKLHVEVGDKSHTLTEKNLLKVTNSAKTTTSILKLADTEKEGSTSNSELPYVSKSTDIKVSTNTYKEEEKSTLIEKETVDDIDQNITSYKESSISCILTPKDARTGGEQLDTPVEKITGEQNTPPISLTDKQSLVKRSHSPQTNKDLIATSAPHSESALVVKTEVNIISESAKRRVKLEEKTESKSSECLTEKEVNLESKSEDLESKDFASKSESAAGPKNTKAPKIIELGRDPAFELKSKEASKKVCSESNTELGVLNLKKEDNLEIEKSASSEAKKEPVRFAAGTQLSTGTHDHKNLSPDQNPTKSSAKIKVTEHQVGVLSVLKEKSPKNQDSSLSEVQAVVKDTSKDNSNFDSSAETVKVKEYKVDAKSSVSNLTASCASFVSEGSSQETPTDKVYCKGEVASKSNLVTSSLKAEVHISPVPTAATPVVQKTEANPTEKINLSFGESKAETSSESASKPSKQESGTINTTKTSSVAKSLSKNEGDLLSTDKEKALDCTESKNIIKAESAENLRGSCPLITGTTGIKAISASIPKEQVDLVDTNTAKSKEHLVIRNLTKTETNPTENSPEACLDITKTETGTSQSSLKSEACSTVSDVIKTEISITPHPKSETTSLSGDTFKETNITSTSKSEACLTGTNIVKTETCTIPTSSKSEVCFTGKRITNTETDIIQSSSKSEAWLSGTGITKTETSTPNASSESEARTVSRETIKEPHTTESVSGNEVCHTDIKDNTKTEKDTAPSFSKSVLSAVSTNITGTEATNRQHLTKVCLFGTNITKTERSPTPSSPKSPVHSVSPDITGNKISTTQHLAKSEHLAGTNSAHSSPKSEVFPAGTGTTETKTKTPQSGVCTVSTDSLKEPSTIHSSSRIGPCPPGTDITKVETNTIQSSLTSEACAVVTGITKTETNTKPSGPQIEISRASTDTDKTRSENCSSNPDIKSVTNATTGSHKSGICLFSQDTVKEANSKLSAPESEFCYPGTKDIKTEKSTSHSLSKSEVCFLNPDITKTETSATPSGGEKGGCSVSKEVTKTEGNTSSFPKAESSLSSTDTAKRKVCLVKTDTTKKITHTESAIPESSIKGEVHSQNALTTKTEIIPNIGGANIDEGLSNTSDTLKQGALARSSDSKPLYLATAAAIRSISRSKSTGITDTSTVVQDSVISEASFTTVNERSDQRVLSKENSSNLTQLDKSTDITKVKKSDSAEGISVINKLLGEGKDSRKYNSIPQCTVNISNIPLPSEVPTSKSQPVKGTKDKTCASGTLSQESTTTTYLEDPEIKVPELQKTLNIQQSVPVVRILEEKSTSSEVENPSDSEREEVHDPETSDSDSDSSFDSLLKMGRRRKTPAGAAEEDKDIVILPSSQRNKKSKEVPTDENSTDGMEEGETSKRASQRTTRGRSKRESSNGDVDQEETVSTRRPRRSSRSASVEPEETVSTRRPRRSSRSASVEPEETVNIRRPRRSSRGASIEPEETVSTRRPRKSSHGASVEQEETVVTRRPRSSRSASVEQEETVTTRRLRRSSRSASVEQDKILGAEVSRSRTRRGSNSQTVVEEDLEMDSEKQQVRNVGTRDDSSDTEEAPQKKSRKPHKQSADSEESEEESKADITAPKGRKLESIEELNESHNETPKKLKDLEKQSTNDSKSSDGNKETLPKSPLKGTEESGQKEKNEISDKEELEKHKQQIDVGKTNTKSGDDDTSAGMKTEVESKKERKELSSPLKLQRNEVKLASTEADRQSPSRSRSSSSSRSPSPKKTKHTEILPSKSKKESGNSNSDKPEQNRMPEKPLESTDSRSPAEESKKPTHRPRLMRNEVKVRQNSPEKSERSRKHSFRSSRSSSDDSSRSPTPKKHKKRRSSSSSSSSSSSRSRSRHSRKRYEKRSGSDRRNDSASGGQQHVSKSTESSRSKGDEEDENSKHRPIHFPGSGKKNRRSYSRSKSPVAKVSKGEDEPDLQPDGTSEDTKRDTCSENKQQQEEEIKEHAVTIDYSSFKSVRKVSLSRGKSREEEETEKPKKKKWGSSSKKPSVDISSASLKTIIPDVKPLSASEVHMGEDSAPESGEASDLEGPIPPPVVFQVTTLNEEEDDDDKEKVESKPRREVREVTSPVPVKQKKHSPSPEEKKNRKVHLFEGPVPSTKPAIAPSRNQPSTVVYIQNLVRPFTINQLRELLQRTGRLTENGFWIDNIKSKCLAMYETEDQALETRMALHGVRWPVSNPKNLFVDFSNEVEMKKRMADFAPPPQKAMEDRRDDRWKREGPVREWDLAKIGERSPGEKERERERLRREREEERLREHNKPRSPGREQEKKPEEPPAKLLDDLFRKTKAQPAIYWLPLTSEQIMEKEALRRQKMAEIERRQAEMKAAREKEQVEWERVRAERRKEREREREREKEKEREREKARKSRSRSRSRRRSRSVRRSPRRSPRRSSRSSIKRSPKRSPGKSPRRSPQRSRSRRSHSRDSHKRRSRSRSRSRS